MVKPGLIVMIHGLKRQGLSISAIARKTGQIRKTVRKHLDAGLQAPALGLRAPQPGRVTPYEDYLRERTAACPDLSVRHLNRELRELGYEGAYSTVTNFLQGVRTVPPAPFERRFETTPSQQAQMDFAEFMIVLGDAPEARRRVSLFLLVLGYSRWLWGRFCANQRLVTVLRYHVAAVAACDVAPREVLYDRMKTAVLGEGEDETVVYNPTLVALLRRYDSAFHACRPYHAKTKCKVERPFRYVRQGFSLAHRFRNLGDLNRQFDRWRENQVNAPSVTSRMMHGSWFFSMRFSWSTQLKRTLEHVSTPRMANSGWRLQS